MLSDKERETLRNFKSEYETCKHNSSDLIIELDDAKIVLNLIEKQSKEIEELKEKSMHITKETVEFVNSHYIHKDKIKSKIEELEKEQEGNRKNLYNAINNLCFKEIDRISNRICVNMTVRGILQSLLEEV